MQSVAWWKVRGDLYSMEALLRLARTQKNNLASRRMLGIAHVLGGSDDPHGGAGSGHGAAGAGRRHQALQRRRAWRASSTAANRAARASSMRRKRRSWASF
jgi:hypothetical protein